MSKCIKIQRKKRQICLGDLDQQITLQDRNITEPDFGKVDFGENFIKKDIIWASVNTVSGKTFFDGVNTESIITHEFMIRYDVSVTAETWILYDNNRYDILKTENYDGRKEFMKLICIDRGLSTLEATKA